MCVAAAILGASAIGAVGSNMAAGKQADAQQQASQTQADMFNKINGQEQPFMKAGVDATDSLSQLLGMSGTAGSKVGNTGLDQGSLNKSFTPEDFKANKDPGYDFQLQQGANAIRSQDSPGAGALSGSALKDLMGFNQGMASTGYQNAFNRFQTQQNNIFGRLSGIAGLGQNAASNTGVAGTQLGIGMGQAQAAAGASQAGGIVGATNSMSNGMMLSSMLGKGGIDGFNGNSMTGYTYKDPTNVGPPALPNIGQGSD